MGKQLKQWGEAQKLTIMIKLTGWCLCAWVTISLAACSPRLSSTGPAVSGTYKQKTETTINGRHRRYLIHLPAAYDNGSQFPLVVVLHGAFSTAREMEKHSGFSVLADRESFIVLYPNGIGLWGFFQHWNSGHCCGKAMRDNIDDVKFLYTMIAETQRRFNIDRTRIYMVGNSNGGMLTYRFAAEHSELVAAIAPVSATIGGKPGLDKPEWRIPTPTMPVPIIAFHGRTDEVVVYGGGRSKRSHGTLTWISVPDSMAFWVTHNRLNKQPVSERLYQGRVLRQTWSAQSSHADVVLYTLEQWGHVWPGRYFTSGLTADDPLNGFDAAEIMWTFFKHYHR